MHIEAAMFKFIFLNEGVDFFIEISMNCVTKSLTDNDSSSV